MKKNSIQLIIVIIALALLIYTSSCARKSGCYFSYASEERACIEEQKSAMIAACGFKTVRDVEPNLGLQ